MQLDFALNILNSLPFGPLGFMLILPLVAALVAYFAGKGARVIALLVTGIELGLSLLLVLGVNTGPIVSTTIQDAGMQFVDVFVMGTISIGTGDTIFQFIIGVDGLSAIMILLSNLVVFVAAISSNHIHKSEGFYYSLFLLLQVGLMGVFMSMDLIGFFIFWELVLIPMFFIIGRWGEEGCEHAAVKFFIYTHLGSAVMLVAFFMMYLLAGADSGTYTFALIQIAEGGQLGLRDLLPTLAPMVQIGFALAIFMGAGVKLPVWPLHNWLPWAHVKAPTPGSVILAGILLKMGGYTFIRLGLWLIPSAFARLSIIFAALAIFTCIYAAFTAMAQTDLKSLVAYTSINHMSWVLLGVAVAAFGIGLDPAVAANVPLINAANLALQGSIFMMFSHGTIISVMFIMAGQLKYSAGTREIPDIKGLMMKAPRLSAILILAAFAAFGLPGFSGFIAEALIIFGSVVIYLWSAIITFGIFVTVGYILWMLNRIVFSDPDPEKEVSEASWSDLIAPILMMIPVILLGVWPDLVLDFTQAVVTFIIGGVAP
ncbi:MAG: complex I subunit 4 family protein [Candidatus Thorarchaeota archaeon]|jgi:NADH-quinone oxidoreductase subunit M